MASHVAKRPYIQVSQELERTPYDQIVAVDEVQAARKQLNSPHARSALYAKWIYGKISVETDSKETTELFLKVINTATLTTSSGELPLNNIMKFKEVGTGEHIMVDKAKSKTVFAISITPEPKASEVTISDLFAKINATLEAHQGSDLEGIDIKALHTIS